MSYVAMVALQNGSMSYLRQPGQPQIVEEQISEGVSVICHSGYPDVLVMESAEELQDLCIKNNIHAKIVELEDVEIIEIIATN